MQTLLQADIEQKLKNRRSLDRVSSICVLIATPAALGSVIPVLGFLWLSVATIASVSLASWIGKENFILGNIVMFATWVVAYLLTMIPFAIMFERISRKEFGRPFFR